MVSYKKKKIDERLESTVKFSPKHGAVTLQTAKDIWGYNFAPTLWGVLLGVREPMQNLWNDLFGTTDESGNNRGDGLFWIQGIVGRGFNPIGKPIMGVSQTVMQSTIGAIDPSTASVQQGVTDSYDQAFPATKGLLSSFVPGQGRGLQEAMDKIGQDFGYYSPSDPDYEDVIEDPAEDIDVDIEQEVEEDSEKPSEINADLQKIPSEIIDALNADADRWLRLKLDLSSASTFVDAVEMWQEFFKINVGVEDLEIELDNLDPGDYDDEYLKHALSNKILKEYGKSMWRLVITTVKEKIGLSDREMLPIYRVYAKVIEGI